MADQWVIDWSAVVTLAAAALAFGAAVYAAKQAKRAAKAVGVTMNAQLRHQRLLKLQESISVYSRLVVARTKREDGFIKTDEFAEIREQSSAIKLLVPLGDPETELLDNILAKELGIATPDEIAAIGDRHLYAVSKRIFARELTAIQKLLET